MMGPLWWYTAPIHDSVGTNEQTRHRVRNVGGSAGKVRHARSARRAPTNSNS
jgi:hypothetical protein